MSWVLSLIVFLLSHRSDHISIWFAQLACVQMQCAHGAMPHSYSYSSSCRLHSGVRTCSPSNPIPHSASLTECWCDKHEQMHMVTVLQFMFLLAVASWLYAFTASCAYRRLCIGFCTIGVYQLYMELLAAEYSIALALSTRYSDGNSTTTHITTTLTWLLYQLKWCSIIGKQRITKYCMHYSPL